MAYLDKAGLTELWKKVKSYVDANGGGTPTTITGNAGTATKLQTTRAIDGVNFNGTADIAHYAVCYTTDRPPQRRSACRTLSWQLVQGCLCVSVMPTPLQIQH